MLRMLVGVMLMSGVLGGCAIERPVSDDAGDQRAGAVLVGVSSAQPLAIGESLEIRSRVLEETRRVNVFVPTIYGERIDEPLPVLYMPDGGLGEDFLHIAGLVQILVSNGGMRPFMLVGIENTQRRRDMTGPTTNDEDRAIAPVVGGSAEFRRFIRGELMPAVAARYRVTDEAAIVGESLAGLFVVETLLLEPDLFDAYIAIDPSLWWSDRELLRSAQDRLGRTTAAGVSVFLASSSEPELAEVTAMMADALRTHGRDAVTTHYAPMPGESHATIYHPAALAAFRTIFSPPGG